MSGPLFNQENPFEIKNLFFNGVLAKIGNSKNKTQLQNYTIKTQAKEKKIITFTSKIMKMLM